MLNFQSNHLYLIGVQSCQPFIFNCYSWTNSLWLFVMTIASRICDKGQSCLSRTTSVVFSMLYWLWGYATYSYNDNVHLSKVASVISLKVKSVRTGSQSLSFERQNLQEFPMVREFKDDPLVFFVGFSWSDKLNRGILYSY